MGDLTGYGIVAVLLAIFGLIIKGKRSNSDPPESTDTMAAAKEILNEHVEEVRKAGDDYSDSISAPVPDRIRDILRWRRKRTGDNGDSDG